MTKGGWVTFDKGSGMVAGVSMATNGTGEPERIMSAEELRAAIKTMAIERQLRRDRKRR